MLYSNIKILINYTNKLEKFALVLLSGKKGKPQSVCYVISLSPCAHTHTQVYLSKRKIWKEICGIINKKEARKKRPLFKKHANFTVKIMYHECVST